MTQMKAAWRALCAKMGHAAGKGLAQIKQPVGRAGLVEWVLGQLGQGWEPDRLRSGMIVGIDQIALLVLDYDEAMAFYCGKLGFRVIEDSPSQGTKRWVRLEAPGKQGSQLLLSRAIDDRQRTQVGNQAAGRVFLFLHTDDLDSDCEYLRAQGVRVTEEPRREPYGYVAVIQDLYGNRIDLIQPHEELPR